MTKQEKRDWYVRKYIESKKLSVTDQYKTPSGTKINIEHWIRNEARDLQGTRYRVLNGNCFFFNCAYSYKKDDKWYLVVHTPSNRFEYELEPGEVKEMNLE